MRLSKLEMSIKWNSLNKLPMKISLENSFRILIFKDLSLDHYY